MLDAWLTDPNYNVLEIMPYIVCNQESHYNTLQHTTLVLHNT